MVKIKYIIGSTRPNRFGPQPANWLLEQSKDIKGASFELLDVADFDLPLYDEEQSPTAAHGVKPHTIKWGKAIEGADAFVWITPEYNHSTSSAMKNAIDFLKHEWMYKPVAMLSYGAAAGGARAAEHLRQIAGELYMYDIREQIIMPSYYLNMDEKGQYQFTEQQAGEANKMLNELVFWAERFKTAREEKA